MVLTRLAKQEVVGEAKWRKKKREKGMETRWLGFVFRSRSRRGHAAAFHLLAEFKRGNVLPKLGKSMTSRKTRWIIRLEFPWMNDELMTSSLEKVFSIPSSSLHGANTSRLDGGYCARLLEEVGSFSRTGKEGVWD